MQAKIVSINSRTRFFSKVLQQSLLTLFFSLSLLMCLLCCCYILWMLQAMLQFFDFCGTGESKCICNEIHTCVTIEKWTVEKWKSLNIGKSIAVQNDFHWKSIKRKEMLEFYNSDNRLHCFMFCGTTRKQILFPSLSPTQKRNTKKKISFTLSLWHNNNNKNYIPRQRSVISVTREREWGVRAQTDWLTALFIAIKWQWQWQKENSKLLSCVIWNKVDANK